MKRLSTIALSSLLLLMLVFVPAEAMSQLWLSDTQPYVLTTRLNTNTTVYCNEASAAFEFNTTYAITCANGSILNWSDHVTNPYVPMAFGSLRSDGVIRMGNLQAPQAVQLPEGYQLYPIEDTSAVLLVDDGIRYNGVADAAYYPDFMSKLDWSHLSLAAPTPMDKFIDGEVYLGLYPYGVGVSSNRQWVTAYSGTYGYVRINLASKQYVSFGSGYSVMYGRRRVAVIATSAITDDGTLVALADNSTDYLGGLKLYGLEVGQTACRLVSERYMTNCPERTLTAQLTSKIANLKGIRTVRFSDNKTLDIETTIKGTSAESYNRYRLSIEPPPANNDRYIALGDSIASGEGAHYYRPGTDVAGGNKCHTSLAAYPYLMRSTGQSVACSGAKMADINGTAWGQRSGRIKDSYTPVEVEQLLEQFTPGNVNQLEFVNKYQPAAVTLSVGGNDLGFAKLLSACIDPRRSIRANGCFPTYEDRSEMLQTIQNQYEPLAELYRRLQNVSPLSRIYIIGYPQLISAEGDCGLNVQLGQDERQAIIAMTTAFNAVIRQAAENSGLHYVDVSEAFAGHKLCESGQAAVNGITAGNDSLSIFGRPILGQEGFHPTAFGHTLLASLISDRTAHLTLIVPAPGTKPVLLPAETDQWRDQADRSGRTTGQRQIVDTIIDNHSLLYADKDKLLDPAYETSVKIDDAPQKQIRPIGDVWSLASGETLSQGVHVIEITGHDQFGRPITLQSTTTIESSPKALSLNVGNLASSYSP